MSSGSAGQLLTRTQVEPRLKHGRTKYERVVECRNGLTVDPQLQEHDPEVVVGFHVGRNELGRFGVAAYSLYQTTLHHANDQHPGECPPPLSS